MPKRRWTTKEDELVRENYGVISNAELLQSLPGRTVYALKHRAKKLGVTTKVVKYHCDESFFTKDTLKSCYWAGFLAADASVVKTSTQTSLVLWLAAKDKEHLRQFRTDLKFTGNIHEYNYQFPSARIIVNSTNLANVLRKRFNITSNKSLTYKPPKRLKSERALAWIKGYIDGDGTIIPYRGKIKINIIGTKTCLTWIRSMLSKTIDIPIQNKIAPRGNVFLLQIAGFRAQEIFNALTQIETPVLQRKWKHGKDQAKKEARKAKELQS